MNFKILLRLRKQKNFFDSDMVQDNELKFSTDIEYLLTISHANFY